MHKLLRFTLLFLLAAPAVSGQTFTGATTINDADTGPLTAGDIDSAGNLYLASLTAAEAPADPAIFSLYQTGDLVISKFSPTGELLWRRDFPGNHARIFDLAATPDGGIILTGGFFDTLSGFGANAPVGYPWHASLMLARLDADGNVVWLQTEINPQWTSNHLGVRLQIRNTRVYVVGLYNDVESALHEHDLTDGALLRIRVFSTVRTLSDLEVDDDGSVFLVGTTGPLELIDSLAVPIPAGGNSGYASFCMRLDADWKAQWIHASRYETFDLHPRVERFAGRIMTLTNDFNGNGAIDNNFILRAFTPDGVETWSYTVLDDAWWNDVTNFSLKTACDRLLLQHPAVYGFNDIGLELRAFDPDLQESLLTATTDGDFSQSSPPFLAAGAERIVYGGNFRKDGLTINDTVTLSNPGSTDNRQLLLFLNCESTTATTTPIPAGWQITPNPVGTTLHLTGPEHLAEPLPAQLYDVQGRALATFRIRGAETRWPVDELAPGVYFLKIGGGRPVILKWVKT